jgi:deoxyinosine 3'endonuclease (endonuclease V)
MPTIGLKQSYLKGTIETKGNLRKLLLKIVSNREKNKIPPTSAIKAVPTIGLKQSYLKGTIETKGNLRK